ncbi:hypothetical protein VIGAN_09177200 [Vigna angularis var. angularis]|uniref:Uncharacterized protein n=1 Tax=Vigna angularis var. angularis TaxID=157739 RepID=A0A0S3SZ71_PHAAN|nr:hypothetical protein VIGAN_09177200 [Vigna angularis var. angularis]
MIFPSVPLSKRIFDCIFFLIDSFQQNPTPPTPPLSNCVTKPYATLVSSLLAISYRILPPPLLPHLPSQFAVHPHNSPLVIVLWRLSWWW